MGTHESREALLLELAALQAVQGREALVIEDDWVQHLVDMAANAEAPSMDDPWVGVSCRASCKAAASGAVAELRLVVPERYPDDPVRCSIAGCGLPRAWADRTSAAAAQLALEAGQAGRPCLHEVVQLVQESLELEVPGDEQQRSEQHGGGVGGRSAAGARAGSGAAAGEADNEVLLLRLDHMHNRQMYVRTISGWAKQLQLTGRVIFQAQLILILLEGPAQHLKEYLVRHRTESVDVDSRGRKCKEHMMEVVVQQPCQQRSVAGGGLAFDGFREDHATSLEDVGLILQRVGLGSWLRAAAGLGGP